MFINNWYAACISAELGPTPRRIRMLGCDFVLFRDSTGQAFCLSDTCCHRGASLAGGQTRDNRISCPQHGWEFDGTGRCTMIPAGLRPGLAVPRKARVPAYPVAEKFGLVFAFLGDLDEAERPVLPDILPEYDQPEAWYCDVIARQKDVNYVRLAENYNDPCHVHYVHEFGRWLPKGVTIETLELDERHVMAFHAAWDDKGKTSPDRGLLMEFQVVGLLSRNTNRQPGYPVTVVVAAVTPIDADNTQIFMLLLQPKGAVTARDHAALITMTRDMVMDEDYKVLKETRPRLSASPAEELLVETDLTVAQVRKMIRDYAAQYGEIDSRTLAERRDAHIQVIPCPDHRVDPQHWVHRTIPLLQNRVAPAEPAPSVLHSVVS